MEKQRRLRTWLFNIIDSGKVDNLEWLNEEKTLFKIPWKHESRNDWLPTHAQVFTEWAKFTGKYREGIDKPDYKMFKTRLRCAFNKAPDIEEETEMRKYKGTTPYRVYKLLPCDKKPVKKPASSSPSSALVPPMAVTQPPLIVEQMQAGEVNSSKVTRSVLAEKIKNRMDLLQAVEVERQAEGMDTKGWTNDEQEDMENEVEIPEEPSGQIPAEVTVKYKAQHSDCGEITQNHKKPEVEVNGSPQVKEHAVSEKDSEKKTDFLTPEQLNSSQSLILLQSTRYRCTLLKNMYELQKNGFLCDLLLRAAGGQVIPVHANVMCGSSSFFKEKVDHWDIGHSGDTAGGCMVLDFEEVPLEVLNSIIQFIYMGEFEVGRETLPQVLEASKCMKLDDLTILCEHVLKALRGSVIDERAKKPVLPKTKNKRFPGLRLCMSFQQPPLMAASSSGQVTAKLQSTSSAPPIPTFLCETEPSAPIVIRPQHTPVTKPIPSDQNTIDKPTTNPSPTSVTQEIISPTLTTPPGIGSWHIPHHGQPEMLKSNPDVREHVEPVNHGPRSLPTNFASDEGSPRALGRHFVVPLGSLPGQGGVGRFAHHQRVCQQRTVPVPRVVNMTMSTAAHAMSSNPLHVLCQAVDETIRSESQSDEDNTSETDKTTQGLLTSTKAPEHSSLPSHWQRVTADRREQVQQPKQLVQAIPPVVLPPPADLHQSGPYLTTAKQLPQVALPEAVAVRTHELSSRDVDASQSNQVQALSSNTEAGRQTSNSSAKDDELFKCKYCSKVFQQSGSRNNHQIHCRQSNEKSTSPSSVPSERRPSSEGPSRNKKDSKMVSEEAIQEIVQRIKEKAGPEGQIPQLPLATQRKSTLNVRHRSRNTRKFGKVHRARDMIVMEDEEKTRRQEDVDQMTEKNKDSSVLHRPKRLKTEYAEEEQIERNLIESRRKGKSAVHYGKRCKVNVTCQECGFRMTSVDQVEEHRDCCQASKPVLNHICDQCGKMFAEETQLERHILRHNKLKSLTCTQCKKVCKSALLLKLHILVHASHKMKFSCMACGKCFMTKKKLELHIRMHLKGQDKETEYECDICKQTFKQKTLLSKHLASHEQIQKEELFARGDSTSQAGGLSKGLKQGGLASEKAHGKSEIYKPLTVKVEEHVVKETTSSPNNLRKSVANSSQDMNGHEGSGHEVTSPENGMKSIGGEMSKKCLICNELFPDHVKKMVHLMSHFQFHADPGKVMCQICSSVLEKDGITAHELSHAKEAPLQCPHCDGAFSDSQELNNHVNEDHMEHACEKCPEVFTSKDELMEHSMMYHGGAKPKEPLVCEVCNRVFNNKYATYEYKRHMYSHTGEKPIPCRFCEKSFKDYSGRSQHEKRVHNRGPLSRGRTKGNRQARNTFVEGVQPSEIQSLGSSPTRHGPPPLVNITMLSEEVKNQFFPSLRTTEAQRTSVDSSKQGAASNSEEAINIDMLEPVGRGRGETVENLSEEEDLSIMVALKGESPTQDKTAAEKPYQKNIPFQQHPQSYIPRNHLPIATPPSYRPTFIKSHPSPPRMPQPHPTGPNPAHNHHPHYILPHLSTPVCSTQQENPMQGRVINNGLLLHTSLGPRGNIQYSLHPAATPPMELLSHLTTSKGNPVISPPHAKGIYHNTSSSPIDTVMSLSVNKNPTIVSIPSSIRPPTTGFARVGNQVKMSNIVAPTVRRQPSASEKEVDTCHKEKVVSEMEDVQAKSSVYPTLPKKRPYVPQASHGVE